MPRDDSNGKPGVLGDPRREAALVRVAGVDVGLPGPKAAHEMAERARLELVQLMAANRPVHDRRGERDRAHLAHRPKPGVREVSGPRRELLGVPGPGLAEFVEPVGIDGERPDDQRPDETPTARLVDPDDPPGFRSIPRRA